MHQRGFTLIELLVVITIIGILAGIVLASLSGARQGANDAKIKQQLIGMRAQAELYTGTGTQVNANTCPTGASANNTLFESANNGLAALFGGLTAANMRCAAEGGLPRDGKNWAVAAQTSLGAWCVDSTGWSSDRSKTGTAYTTTLTTAIAANTFTCL